MSIWVAFALGALVGFVLAGIVRLMHDEGSGWPVDVTRPRLSWYGDGKAGVEVWRKR